MATTTTTEPEVTPQLPSDDPGSLLPKKLVRARPLFDPEIVRKATAASFVKLNPVTCDKRKVFGKLTSQNNPVSLKLAQ